MSRGARFFMFFGFVLAGAAGVALVIGLATNNESLIPLGLSVLIAALAILVPAQQQKLSDVANSKATAQLTRIEDALNASLDAAERTSAQLAAVQQRQLGAPQQVSPRPLLLGERVQVLLTGRWPR